MDAIDVSWSDAFLGTIPGSLGETSALACLFGAVILIYCGVGSWRIMVSMPATCRKGVRSQPERVKPKP